MRDTVKELLNRFPRESAIAMAALAALLLLLMVSTVLARAVNNAEQKGHLQPAMARRLHLARRWALGLLTPLILLQATGMAQHAWTMISTVIAAVAIGFFAAWSLLSNATSALLLLAFRPFRLGDHIELVEHTTGIAIGGKVVDMSLMFITLEDAQSRPNQPIFTRVPNSMIFQKLVRVRAPHPVEEDLPFFAED